MVSPTDKEYQQTKQIMLGKAAMNADFMPLAKFIDETFSVRTINIVYDTIERGTVPRLGVYFETLPEKESFYADPRGMNFDGKKQHLIAKKFKEIIAGKGLSNNKNLFSFLARSKAAQYLTEHVFVYYSAFEPIAKDEANEGIPQEKVMALKAKLNCEDLWEISRCFSWTTFFVYTEEQLKQYKNSEVIKKWADNYFELLEPYNEFGYFKRNTFEIRLDSKENFDKNFQSNWYYYYK